MSTRFPGSFPITIKPLKNPPTHKAPPSAQAWTCVLRSLVLSGRTPFPFLSHPFFKSSLSGFWWHLSEYFYCGSHFSFMGTLTAFLSSGLLFTLSDLASCVSSNILHCLVQFFLSTVKGAVLWIICFLSILWDFLLQWEFSMSIPATTVVTDHMRHLGFWNVSVWLN